LHYLTKRADYIVRLAKKVAREYGQGHVGTEHLLLAIIREGTGLGAKILIEHGATEERVRAEVAEQLKTRLQETWVMGRWPGAPNFKDLLTKAAEAAKGSGNWQICSGHLLFALLEEEGSTGSKTLRALGLEPQKVRDILNRTECVSQAH